MVNGDLPPRPRRIHDVSVGDFDLVNLGDSQPHGAVHRFITIIKEEDGATSLLASCDSTGLKNCPPPKCCASYMENRGNWPKGVLIVSLVEIKFVPKAITA